MLPVAILAGGLATRLHPITEKIPKSLVQISGKPFLEHQLELLRGQGIERAVLCVGHLGGMIRDVFGDGSSHGIRLDYSFDGPELLGTGGALAKALPLLGEKFFALYGDSYLPIEFGLVAEAFARAGKPALMTIFQNDNRWDASNVRYEGGRILAYDKKRRTPAMRHIDYGLSVLSPAAFEDGKSCDLAGMLSNLAVRGELAACEVTERFYEIGSPAGLEEFRRYVNDDLH